MNQAVQVFVALLGARQDRAASDSLKVLHITKRSSARQAIRRPLPVSSAATPMRAPERSSAAIALSSARASAGISKAAPATTARREMESLMRQV